MHHIAANTLMQGQVSVTSVPAAIWSGYISVQATALRLSSLTLGDLHGPFSCSGTAPLI